MDRIVCFILYLYSYTVTLMAEIRYGGHYGPTFAAYFLQQNAAITAGTLSGIIINLKTLGIGNGLTVNFHNLSKQFLLMAKL